MRIVSLSPSCTEWVAALDASEHLVGRSHACDYPPPLKNLPSVTSCTIEVTSSRSIYDEITKRVDNETGLQDVDLDLIAHLEPDLILAQSLDGSDAQSLARLEKSISTWPEKRASIFSMHASSFKQVLNEALRLAASIGRTREAMTYIAVMERRLAALRNLVGIDKRSSPESLPTIMCIEWLDPIVTATHWIPDMVELAGGRPLAGAGTFSGSGPFAVDVPRDANRSRADKSDGTSRLEGWEAVRRADPDVLAVLPHGFDLETSRRELVSLTDRPGWRDLTAVKSDRVFAFDARAYFSRPGPRLYRGIELLACALHPNRAAGAVKERARHGVEEGSVGAARVWEMDAVRDWEMEIVRSA